MDDTPLNESTTAPALIEIEGHTFRLHGGEPRVRDLDLAGWLGFERPREIRRLIDRHLASGLLDEREVCVAATQTSPKGGRPGREYWLSHTGAVKIAAKSEGPQANAILSDVVRAWDAVRRAVLHLPPVLPAPAEAPPGPAKPRFRRALPPAQLALPAAVDEVKLRLCGACGAIDAAVGIVGQALAAYDRSDPEARRDRAEVERLALTLVRTAGRLHQLSAHRRP